MSRFGLPFAEIVMLDFEFRAQHGEPVDVICLVAGRSFRDASIGSGATSWAGAAVPAGDDVLFVVYRISAEAGCMRARLVASYSLARLVRRIPG